MKGVACPKCGHDLLQKSETKLKIRVPILVFDDKGEKCVTSCPRCKEEIPLPVTLNKSALATEPKLFIDPARLTKSTTRP